MELNSIKKDYGFEMKKEDKEYHIKTTITEETLKIEIEYILGVKKSKFSNSFTYKEIIKLNHYFNICLTLNEIFEELINLISQGKSSFIIENNKMIFIIPTTIKIIKEVKFELNKENKDNKSEIDNIMEILNQQIKRIKYLEEENNNKNEIIKELKLKISPFTENDFNLVNQFINNNIKKIKLELLFDSQRDGFRNKTFFHICKYKTSILTLFKTINGEKFGAYISTYFCEDMKCPDEESFLFSIDFKKKYPPRQFVDYALNLRNDRGPRFGYSPDMGAYKDMKYGWVIYDKNSTFLENDYFTQGKERELEFSNIEIYQVFK